MEARRAGVGEEGGEEAARGGGEQGEDVGGDEERRGAGGAERGDRVAEEVGGVEGAGAALGDVAGEGASLGGQRQGRVEGGEVPAGFVVVEDVGFFIAKVDA